ncbi:enoyl-CoA hydratase/isomerase family protein 16 [Achromobacter xylosoxidans A8]|uniref:Enoyl-CoA hydratase/isomerase family protein 16 n=1 Tax=Achromobacter xylosoxidans (strain A8) TaxID=762376 RepID=E3HR69_ACHXA|nr:enoyl-CoA hydratase-related protein [Achromobacter xylosoxidans]ADP17203.1 enoyl-CoA hydratase/isomerase family protein 16 [Achromobacter xylosoxidans A8]
MAGTPDAQSVTWHVQDHVGHIMLNRPEDANAIDLPFALAFSRVVEQAARADIGAVLLSAAGKQYCAGGDINAFAACEGTLDSLIGELLDILNPAVARLAALPLPVISAVHAPVGGAGIALALCADIVLASPAMKLRGGYSALGLSPDIGASYFLALRAGAARAKYILMTNRAMPAEECLRLGLVDEVWSQEDLQDAAVALAGRLAAGATGALGGIKRLCEDAGSHDLPTHLEHERRALLRCARAADCREGIAAFRQKRPPRFDDPRID